MVEKADVIWCYRNLLDREPESVEAIEHLSTRFRDLRQLLKYFVESDEYTFSKSGAFDPLPANPIDLELTPAQRQTLWDHIGNVWQGLGTVDPYWSVLTSEEFRLANMTDPDRIDRFYESGRKDIERTEKYLARHRRRLPERGICVDYGCGLGRTTLWLAQQCERVLALDVSQSHLAIARDRLAASGISNVTCQLVRRSEDLAVLRGIDLFHSVIVLQHNPPPLIIDILSAVFDGLNPGGCAFFQVPTSAANYQWRYDDYIRDAVPSGVMEMHVLPQAVIFDLATKSGCALLEVQPDNYRWMAGWTSNTFLFIKPAAA